MRALLPIAASMSLLVGLGVAHLAAAQESQATPEPVSQAQNVVSRGERLSSTITAMKTQAERAKDIVKVTCLNNILAQVNANVRSASGRLKSLRDAISVNDRGAVNHHLTVVQVLGQKLTVLDGQANQCIGQDVFETGDTKVETSVDNTTVPTDNESGATTVPDLLVEPDPGTAQVEAVPLPKEASSNGDEG